MDSDDVYEASPAQTSRASEQVELYESSGGQLGNTAYGTTNLVIILTTRGKNTGRVRKNPLMRVEHEGEYALIASLGGGPKNPAWYYNLQADPSATIQDGSVAFAVSVRQLLGDERNTWWQRAVQTYATYAEYENMTEREIPVLLATAR